MTFTPGTKVRLTGSHLRSIHAYTYAGPGSSEDRTTWTVVLNSSETSRRCL